MKPRHPLHPYLMLAPTALVLGLFFLYPLALALKLSFYQWDLLTPPRWVGLRNYATLFASGELAGTAARTLGYSLVVVSLSVTLGLSLAVALDRPGRIYAFVRGAVFSAYVVSWVAVVRSSKMYCRRIPASPAAAVLVLSSKVRRYVMPGPPRTSALNLSESISL